jgi:hypothetical protein
VGDPETRRGSDVLDAIFEKVEGRPDEHAGGRSLFRPKALAQLDVAAEVDNQLPLVSRRNWLALVGLALLVAAFAVWASLTPSVTSVSASGRTVAAPGVAPVSVPATGVVVSLAAQGQEVSAGQSVGVLRVADASVQVATEVPGTVWQQQTMPGATVERGAAMASLLPPGSGAEVLLAVTEQQAAPIRVDMRVELQGQGLARGRVASVGGPLTAEEAGRRVALDLPPAGGYVLVTVACETPLPPGSLATGSVVLSDGTVLTRFLGL